jgi:hypothetical protein
MHHMVAWHWRMAAYLHLVIEVLVERARNWLGINLILVMAKVLLSYDAGWSNFDRLFLVSLVSLDPQIHLAVEAIVAFVVRVVSWIAYDLMHPRVDNFGRLLHHQHTSK